MKIYAYMSSTDDTPNGQWVARIYLGAQKNAETGKVKTEWHPVIFAGLNEGSVRTAAQVWWDAELAKREAKPRKPKAETPLADDPGDVL